MAKPIAEYRTSGGATVTAKSGYLTGHAWTCNGCDGSDDRAPKGGANDHAKACHAIPRPRRTATRNAGATSARKD